MKSILYIVLLVVFGFGLSACNDKESEVTQAEPQKPVVIQEAEEIETILNEKAEADKQAIDDATQ
jgi:type IV pilus biogenesis protein CpaD/CtpE